MVSKARFRLIMFFASILVIIAYIVGDEFVMFNTFGTSRGVSCSDGQLHGAAAQRVCIREHTVVKVSKPCTDISNVLACKTLYWKQIYTNAHWGSYSKSPLIPNVFSNHNKDGIVMERVKFPQEQKKIIPDFKFNMEKLLEFDEMLSKNGHIALDVQPFTNAVLDETGKMHIIDFNLMPSWSRGDTERNDKYCFILPPFANIYGGLKLLNWIVPPTATNAPTSSPSTMNTSN